MSVLERARVRLGRRLLRGETQRVIDYYSKAARLVTITGHADLADRCADVARGARYVGKGWPHAQH